MSGALSGLRVVDFGIITAGASTSAILADLGAEVIKVEGPTYLDPFRIWVGRGEGDEWWNDSPQFSFTNRNKRGLCVDLKSPEGRRFVLDLVARSHIVVENFRVGVLDRLGLGFEALKARNPSIILASISSQGLTGPDSSAVSFGSTLEASSGFSSLVTAGDGQPLISGHALNYPDQIVSLAAAGMILAAVVEMEGGAGATHLDISQRELTTFLLGECFASGKVAAREGEERIAASADGRWIAFSVPERGAALDAAEAEAVVECHPAAEAARRLREAGIDVETVHEAIEVYSSHAEDGSVAAFAEDPGGHPVKGLPWRAGEGDLSIERSAPRLGGDNEYIAQGVLGLSVEEYERLVAAGVLATAPQGR